MSHSGKVAIVTGGAQGIGRAIARRLSCEGAAVVIADVQRDKGTAVAEACIEGGGRALFTQTDVREPDQVTEMVGRARDAFGRLDILVNNAYEPMEGTAEDVDAESWDRGYQIMVRTIGLAARAAVPEMRRLGGGSIVNISSVHGLLAADRSVVYEACKHAVIGLTRAMAVDFGPDEIRVNAVCPGAIITEATDAAWRGHRPGAALTELLYPLRRAGVPDDVAAAVSFLVSDEAAFITGHSLVVDGGLSIQLQDALAERVRVFLADGDDGRPLRTPPVV
jgi:NAD(P)-dependent dehydrogenase (short-subunit alcohol dehydrogenase family)